MDSGEETYLGEIARNARPLAAAAIGSASGLMVAAYTTATFSPYIIREFHWPKEKFALVGLTMLSTILIVPFIGRLTDRRGVRPLALTGTLLLPLPFLGYSTMQGNFLFFLSMSALTLATGSFTTPAVYARLVAENFVKARGLALFIVTGVPALAGAVLPRILIAINDSYGWRWGYRALAAYFLIGGLIAVSLVPKHEPGLDHRAEQAAARGARPPGAFREILRTPAFWILTGAMMLCMLPTSLHSAQMLVMLRDAGMNHDGAANAMSAYAIGALAGRAACGLALDRLPPPRVAAASMVLPALGYALLGPLHAGVGMVPQLMFLIGLSYGAENDLPSFLTARHFRVEVFSSAMSLAYCGMLLASAGGAILLAAILRYTGSFAPFMTISAISVLAGSLLFLALPSRLPD